MTRAVRPGLAKGFVCRWSLSGLVFQRTAYMLWFSLLTEERHSDDPIAIVAAGSFQYRPVADRELMTQRSLTLGRLRPICSQSQ